MKSSQKYLLVAVAVAGISATPALGQAPVGTAFSFQGQLKLDGTPFTGLADFYISLWDAPTEGTSLAMNLYIGAVDVTNGLFTVDLDFGDSVFGSEARWLEVAVRTPIGVGNFTPLEPRYELTPVPYALALPGLHTREHAASPSVIAGWKENQVMESVAGATVSGGGAPLIGGNPRPNQVTDNYGTIGGGSGNRAGDGNGVPSSADHATVGGGYANDARASNTTVAGGWYNRATQNRATVGGGWNNLASGDSAVVAGGRDNQATGNYSFVGGGAGNVASAGHTSVIGGLENAAQGAGSVAAGRRAKAMHAGSFVWADYNDVDFASTAANQFLVRAAGGVGIGTNNPTSMLTVNGTIETKTGIKFPDGTEQTSAASGGESLWMSNGSSIYYSAGRVGIGTADPAIRLDVNGPARIQGVAWPGSGAGLELAYSSDLNRGYIQAYDRGTAAWGSLYLGDGKVGIGVLNPTSKLAVRGVIESTSGGIQFPDGSRQTTAAVSCWDLNENGVADAAEDVNGDGSVNVLDCRGETGPPTTTSALCAGTNRYPEPGACDGICNGTVVAEVRHQQCSVSSDTGSCTSSTQFLYGLCCVCSP